MKRKWSGAKSIPGKKRKKADKRANSSGKDERSEFLAGEEQNKGSYQSGQMGQTVNLLAYAFGGSNPSLPTKKCRLELQDFQWCPPAGIAEGEG